ncbi:uncharacterized protein, partial [Penaeus vannamei]|uniref:uncharacterized protein n=1 Tax=Penaeus vannamei TaxID=6689 RepID=UPI00387F82D9
MGLVIEKEKAGSDETHGEGNTKGDKKKRRGRRKEKDEGISEEESEEKGEKKEAKGRERRKKRRSIWFGSSFAKVDKVTADDLIGRGEEGDDTFYEGKGKRIKLRERRGGGGKEEDRGKGKRKRQKERRGGSQDDRDLPRDFCPSLPDRQDDLHDLDDFLKTLERKSSCQAPRSSVPAGEILHLPPGPILPYQLRPRQASPDRKVPLQPPKPASFENKLRQHHPRRRTSLETIEEDPLTFVFRESRMRSYPHEADLTCCVGEAGSPPGFLLTRSVTFSDLTWPGGEGDDPGSSVGDGEGGVAEAGSGSGASEGGTRRVDFGDAEFEDDIDGVTKDDDDETVRIEGEMRDHASYGMTVSVYGVCDVHRAPPLARPHDVTRDEVREVLQAGLEELFVGWQEDDTYGMLAGLFREEEEDRGTDGEEKGIGDEERGKSDCRDKGSREREDNGEGATNDEGGTEYAREGKARETARIENRLDMEDDEENETGDEGVSELTENGVGERTGDEGTSERTENEGQRKENERVSERTENERASERTENEGASERTENEVVSERKENERASARTENERPRKENGDGEESPRPIPQLSFHIYIHQQKSVSESPSEEPYPRERDPQEAEPTNEESPKSEDENHETLSEAEGNGARGRPNEAPTWLRRQYRMNLVGGKIPEHRIVPDLSIQSLDTLNDQIVEFIFSGTELDDSHGGSPKQREALKASMSLMRRLLVDAQSKFRKMVEDNKQLASRIDGDLQTAHQEVNLLRQELADTNRRITQLQAHNQNHDDPNLRKCERRIKELAFQTEEDKKN